MKYIFIIVLFLFSCKKEKPKTYEITYTFHSSSTPYFIQIWDGTNLNDFSDSIYSPNFSKTIVYEYKEMFQCLIDCKIQSNKTIKIKSEVREVACSDTLYPTLSCFTNL